MKKEATPKCRRLKIKTSDEKRRKHKMQGAQKSPPMKKESTPKCKGLENKDLR
jgi:hypothetical protein